MLDSGYDHSEKLFSVDQDLLFHAMCHLPKIKTVTSKCFCGTREFLDSNAFASPHLPKKTSSGLTTYVLDRHNLMHEGAYSFFYILQKHWFFFFFFTFLTMTQRKNYILQYNIIYSFICNFKTKASFIKQYFPLIHSIYCTIFFILFFPIAQLTIKCISRTL